jgi:hypothetical protein
MREQQMCPECSEPMVPDGGEWACPVCLSATGQFRRAMRDLVRALLGCPPLVWLRWAMERATR